MDIEAAKARCAAATEGLWWSHEGVVKAGELKHGIGTVRIATCNNCEQEGMFCSADVANGQHIAHARTDLPDAIELIEEMAPLLERARGMTPFGQQWFDDVAAVLARIRPEPPACDATDGKAAPETRSARRVP